MNVNDIIYGNNNEEYFIEKIDKDYIIVKYTREILITFNANNDKKKETRIETLTFYFNQIGINIFFKKNDCKKDANELLEDVDYREYKDNIYNRIKQEELIKIEKLKAIKNYAPEIKMSKTQKDTKLLSYENKEISQKEEEDFYNTAKETYFARLDLDTEYYKENYYERFYISKETRKKKIQKGIFERGIYISPEELKSQGRENLIENIELEEGINKKYNNGIKVVNWASPIANLYYEKENNTFRFNDYKYEVMLRRSIMFNPIRYVNNYIENNTLYKEGVVDEFLLNILMEKRNSDKLTDIIYSIQSNQNKIIRADKDENFIVQGCAGSGKTMILLHRLSYLKLNKKLPEYDKIKIITPNKLFSNFINELSHDLDISEIEQITISNYYSLLINIYIKRYNKIKYIIDESREVRCTKDEINKIIDNKYSKYKRIFEKEKMLDENELNSETIKKLYSKEVFEFIKNEYNEKINEAKQKIKRLEIFIEWNSNNYQYFEISINKLIKKLEEEEKRIYKLQDNLKNQKEKLEVLKIKSKGEEYQNLKINKEKCKRLKEQLINIEKEYTKLIEKNKKIFNKIKNFVTSNKDEIILKNASINLQEKIENLEKDIEIGQKSYDELKEKITNNEKECNKIEDIINKVEKQKEIIKNEQMEILNNMYFTIDFYEYIIEKLKVINLLPIEKGKFVKVQLLIFLYINYLHFGPFYNNNDSLLCFDEAQDYNIIEYRILKKVNNNIVFNLYGDVNQSFYAEGIFDWQELIETFKLKKYCLNENYRNTFQITEFCNKLLNFNVVPMGLDGKKIEYIKENDIIDIIDRKIKEKRKIVLIYKDKSDLNNIENKIQSEFVIYSTVNMVKGMEYDTAIVKDNNMNKNEKYISYTRALNELYIIRE